MYKIPNVSQNRAIIFQILLVPIQVPKWWEKTLSLKLFSFMIYTCVPNLVSISTRSKVMTKTLYLTLKNDLGLEMSPLKCAALWDTHACQISILMQLFCNKYFEWLEHLILRTWNQQYPVTKWRGSNYENIYPYVYIQIYFHSSDFARILTIVLNLKKINTFESGIST